MFIVGDYQVSFRKSYSLILSENKGRFNTVCEISIKYSENLFKGIAYLHPKDSPNRIIGKKVALTKALANMNADKYLRTVIWGAFWKWVESWKKKPGCFGSPTQESDLCNNCSYLNQCVNKLWKETSSNPNKRRKENEN